MHNNNPFSMVLPIKLPTTTAVKLLNYFNL